MSLQSRLAALITQIGADIKALQSMQDRGFSLTRSLGQNITTTATFRIAFDGAARDVSPAGFSNANDWWVAPTSDWYVIHGGIHVSSAASTPAYLFIEVIPAAGGASVYHNIDNRKEADTINLAPFMSGSKVLFLNAGDKVALATQWNSTNGGAAFISASPNTYFQGFITKGPKGDPGPAGAGVNLTGIAPARDAEVKAKAQGDGGYAWLHLIAEDGQPGSGKQSGIEIYRDDPDVAAQAAVRVFADPESGTGTFRISKLLLDGLGQSDFAFRVPVVQALPGSPKDGMELIFQNQSMMNNGVAWHLRYRAYNADGSANTNTHKWELVGGSFFHARNPAAVSLGALAYPGPEHTIPLSGWYEISQAWNGYTNGSAGISQSDLYNGSNVAIDSGGENVLQGFHDTSASSRVQPARTALCPVALTAGQIVRMGFQSDAAAGQHNVRWRDLGIRPVRVG
jgi:hypothetical protein